MSSTATNGDRTPPNEEVTSRNGRSDENRIGAPVFVVGIAVVAIEVGGVYAGAITRGAPDGIAYGLPAVVAVVIGGSFLTVAYRSRTDRRSPSDRSTLTRASELVVAIAVMTVLTGVAYVVGLVLSVVARLGGPDPHTADGDPLRRRLLGWVERNRDFMRSNGMGELPLRP